MNWYSPWAFALLPVLLVAIAYHYWLSRKKTPTVQYSSLSLMRDLPKPWRMRLLALPLILTAAGLALMVVALARPQRADTKVRKNVEGIDIMLVLDVSDSMLIEDMQPNRLEAAKGMLKSFVKNVRRIA